MQGKASAGYSQGFFLSPGKTAAAVVGGGESLCKATQAASATVPGLLGESGLD